ncbi:hypothetical protein QWM81_12695 [Streptomyces ficellus]|uniref:Uncharacterized protein n=1 Tax=Streptomyces ficellus TaxID=1977088 RepID=A0ABT7Z743_9ACTN|nr:hypothetical protein [Streptomyces ficellus]MDN3294896.1 hypothetical protein [Streptomyces ficellus]
MLLPSPRSICAAGERTVDDAEAPLEQNTAPGLPVHVRKQIVHDTHVVDDLQRHGTVHVDDLARVPAGARVVSSAHSVYPRIRPGDQHHGVNVVSGTCRLVTKASAQARGFAARGETTLLTVHAEHEELEGTFGEIPHSTGLGERVPSSTHAGYSRYPRNSSDWPCATAPSSPSKTTHAMEAWAPPSPAL